MRLVLRSRIVLLAAEGRENAEIAEALGVARGTIGKWRTRFAMERFVGIEKDAPRSGRRRKYSRTLIADVVRKTTQETPAGQTTGAGLRWPRPRA